MYCKVLFVSIFFLLKLYILCCWVEFNLDGHLNVSKILCVIRIQNGIDNNCFMHDVSENHHALVDCTGAHDRRALQQLALNVQEQDVAPW